MGQVNVTSFSVWPFRVLMCSPINHKLVWLVIPFFAFHFLYQKGELAFSYSEWKSYIAPAIVEWVICDSSTLRVSNLDIIRIM